MTPKRDHAILYDSDCGFCKLSARMLSRVDRDERLRFVAIQGEEGRRLLAEMPEEQRLESMHLVTPGGTVVSGGAAAEPLSRVLPVGTVPTRLFRRYPERTERLYRWFAGNRTRFGRLGIRTDEAPPEL